VCVYLCGDDIPEEINRIELDWEHTDAIGMPGVKTFYRLGENSQRLGADMIRRARQVLEAAGATSVRDFGLSPIWGWHLMGTSRMGGDPTGSVVDRHNQAHDVANPYTPDSSSLPTSGGGHPTSTHQ